jgi:hypothetical protein
MADGLIVARPDSGPSDFGERWRSKTLHETWLLGES